jgi:NAD(P)-dependent dehydrogenase (short-subunit alcohol dehydrogenase family)
MFDSLKDRVALVTGGGSGIGAAAGVALAKYGVRVALLGRTGDELNEYVQKIEQSGGQAMAVVADISNADEMQAAIAQVTDTWGRLDIVFANAGINGVWAPLDDLTPEEWDRTLDINLKGTFLTVKYALPHLRKRGGSVIITSSVNGTRMFSNTGATAYACSKAAQVAFAKMTALELAPDKVRVNVICPGAIESHIDENTERRNLEAVKTPVEFPEGEIPLTHGSPGTAEQVADLVVFLASDGASHISGTEMWIDGAQSLIQG